ncbi:MAG: DUF6134 family protein [Geminicoccaceae bacterium]
MLSLFAALSLIASGSAWACTTPESPAVYVINHETYGDIGTHVLTFSCDGDNLIVETDVDVKVKILFVTAYERRAHYREVWQDDRLISYEAKTDDGGDLYVTTARVDGDRMIVDGIEKAASVPLDTVSSHPWNVATVDRPTIFGQRDGRIRHVQVEPAGWETLKISGKQRKAQKFVVHGDLERELFYDGDGTWLQWRLKRDGKTVTITKQ